MIRRPPRSTRTDTLLPYTTLFRSLAIGRRHRSHLSFVIASPFQRFVAMAPFGGTYLARSEEHTSELQSLMRISYAVFCLTKNIELLMFSVSRRLEVITCDH